MGQQTRREDSGSRHERERERLVGASGNGQQQTRTEITRMASNSKSLAWLPWTADSAPALGQATRTGDRLRQQQTRAAGSQPSLVLRQSGGASLFEHLLGINQQSQNRTVPGVPHLERIQGAYSKRLILAADGRKGSCSTRARLLSHRGAGHGRVAWWGRDVAWPR